MSLTTSTNTIVFNRRTALIGALATLSGCASPLSAFNQLAPHDGATHRAARDVAYGEGSRRTLDVFVPNDVRDAPVIVFFYGGSWSSGSKNDYSFVGAAFASRGFVTVVPDYRVFPEVAFPDFLVDAAAAVRWVQDNAQEFGGDPQRIVVAGFSAGAHIAMMLGLDRRYLSGAGVDSAKIRGVAGLAGPYAFLPLNGDRTLEDVFGRAADLPSTQPATFARRDAPPLLLLWGEDDDMVSRRSIVGLEAAMRAAGGPVEAKIYPALGHAGIVLALSRPLRRRAPVLRDVATFAARVTGSR